MISTSEYNAIAAKAMSEEALLKAMKLTIILPFKLPTRNQTMNMHGFERQKVTNWIKEFVSESLSNLPAHPIQMGLTLKPQLTELSRLAYYAMIRPRRSRKYAFAQKLRKRMKR